jgi:hypothetical protein
MDKDFVRYFLPAGLLEHFTITSIEEKDEESTKSEIIEIDLEEMNQRHYSTSFLKSGSSQYALKSSSVLASSLFILSNSIAVFRFFSISSLLFISA